MYNNNNKIKWRTELEIVEEATGLIIPKYLVEQKKYITIKKQKRSELNKEQNTGRRIITWIVEENRQQTLF